MHWNPFSETMLPENSIKSLPLEEESNWNPRRASHIDASIPPSRRNRIEIREEHHILTHRFHPRGGIELKSEKSIIYWRIDSTLLARTISCLSCWLFLLYFTLFYFETNSTVCSADIYQTSWFDLLYYVTCYYSHAIRRQDYTTSTSLRDQRITRQNSYST